MLCRIRIWKTIALLLYFLTACLPALIAQSRKPATISFFRLDKATGLPDNIIWDMCLDKNNFLWIATGDGLCSFDGKKVTHYFSSDYPQLRNNHIRQVVCDSSNRIWVLQEEGHITLIDEYRNFHAVNENHGLSFPVKRVFSTVAAGVLLFTRTGLLKTVVVVSNKEGNTQAAVSTEAFPAEGFDKIKNKDFLQYEVQDDENVFFATEKKIYLLNVVTRKLENEYDLPHTTVLNRTENNKVTAFDRIKRRFFLFDKHTKAVTFPFDKLADEEGRSVKSIVTNSRMMDDNHLLVTTSNEGVFIWSLRENKLHNYRHNVSDAASIANNFPKVIAGNPAGWIFLSSTPNGISYFNSRAAVAQQTVFINDRGEGYDGHINSIASFDDSIFYLAVSSSLIKWNSTNNKAVFLGSHKPTPELLTDGVRAVACDNKGHIWVSVPRLGVFVRDKANRFIKHFFYDSLNNNGLPSNYTQSFTEQGQYMWLATAKGICRINTTSLQLEKLPAALSGITHNQHCNTIWFEGSSAIWVCTRGIGAVNYNFSTGEIIKYNTGNGLASNHVLAVNKDARGYMYFGTVKGLSILAPDGNWKTYAASNGLLNDRVEIIQPDNKGRMWIGNSTGLACYNSADGLLRVFDEQDGLTLQGFRGPAFYKTAEGRLFWGTEKGVQFFFPDDLLGQQSYPPGFINRIETKNGFKGISGNVKMSLGADDNNLAFYFSTVDYNRPLRTYYAYKLEGADPDWNITSDPGFVRYSSLKPGRYTFFVKTSNDKINWHPAANTVTIIIAKKWWQQFWFRAVALLLTAGIFYAVIRYFRNKQQRRNEELESELVINYFASQINSRYKTDELLWDVARNLIGKIGFENCMIYLWNEDKTILIQKAGYGTKGSMPAIMNREGYNIPKGKGIVGAAVESKQGLLVNDTSKDKRYFTADGTVMLSELCVPLIHGNEILGAINIEHRRKNVFTAKDMQMLSTIALLCANQVQRIKAEEEKQQAKLEILENKRRAMEFRLQSLRLQMNPHFLFNALNSVQQMILANEEMVATRYLSRFSKLLRTILVHSDNENISLKEEIEILNLYAELESIRFKGSFTYEITCEESIDQEEVTIPALLVQPFVENAIWHGLMHKEGNRLLRIQFAAYADMIRCTVEDNGVGRKKSAEFKLVDNGRKNHKSRGIEVSLERLKAMPAKKGQEGSIVFIDKTDEDGQPAGTIVQINFPQNI